MLTPITAPSKTPWFWRFFAFSRKTREIFAIAANVCGRTSDLCGERSWMGFIGESFVTHSNIYSWSQLIKFSKIWIKYQYENKSIYFQLKFTGCSTKTRQIFIDNFEQLRPELKWFWQHKVDSKTYSKHKLLEKVWVLKIRMPL